MGSTAHFSQEVAVTSTRRTAGRSPMIGLVLGLVLSLAHVTLTGAPAYADGILTGRVSDGETGIPGAFVAVVGTAGRFTTVTDDEGDYSVDALPAGAYTVSAQAPKYAAGRAAVTVTDDSTAAASLVLVSSGSMLSSAPVYGAQIGTVLSGGVSGVFYATTSVIPQIFRTSDYGGTWSPVTTSADDPQNGLSGVSPLSNKAAVAVSTVPGEIAVIMSSRIRYSRDFGITWQTVAGTFASNWDERQEVHWGHVGDTSVLLAVDGDTMYRADMTAASPALVEMSDGYGEPADTFTVAAGADAPWVAALESTGTLRLYRLTLADPAVETGTPLTGLPDAADLVQLGGTSEAGHPPSAALVFSAATDQVAVAFKEPAADSFTSVSALTAVPEGPEGCGIHYLPSGREVTASVASASGGDGATATLGSCLVRSAGAGQPVDLDYMRGTNSNAGLAFDVGYGTGDNRVILSADGGRGLVKSAHADEAGVPVFPSDQDATAGAGADSGGVSVNGLNVAVVKDATYGPAANQYATILSMSGGGLGVATDDGGVTTQIAVRKGGTSVAWWTGASGIEWLLYGHGGYGDLLSAFTGWTSETPALDLPNVAGTTGADLHYPGNPDATELRALTGVPGADTVFAGLGPSGGGFQAQGSLARIDLATGGEAPTVADITQLAADDLGGTVDNLAYCPAGGSADSVADVLFAAVDTGTGGRIVRIAGATGDSPVTTVVTTDGTDEIDPVREVEADCAAGMVWAGANRDDDGSVGVGLLRSVDGGISFAAVAGLPARLHVTALAVNPARPAELLLAANADGLIARTVDGGNTWTTVNDPTAGGRNFSSEGVSVLAFPPTAAAASTHGVPTVASAERPSLVGTGGGLFTASVGSTVKGLFFATNRLGSWPTATRVPASGSTSADPALVVDSSGNAALVHRGSDGLYLSTRTAAGAWSGVGKVTATVASDAQPTLRHGPAGSLHLVFARIGGVTGVYYTSKAVGGSWAAPRRLAAVTGYTYPALAVDNAGKVHVAYRRSTNPAGIYHLTGHGSIWAAAKVPGTSGLDTMPGIVMTASTAQLVFARAGTAAGIYTAAKTATGRWTTPVRRTTGRGDATPSLARDGTGKLYVAFRRTASPAGLYLTTNRTGTWSAPARVVGTGSADTAPALVAGSTTLRLAFVRSGSGLFLTSRSFAGGWAPPALRTSSALDRTPALAVDGSGREYLVVDRG